MEVFADPVYYLFGNNDDNLLTNMEFNSTDMSSLFKMDQSTFDNISTLQEEAVNLQNLDFDI